MKRLKKEFMGRAADFIFRAIINNPFIKLENKKFDLISISSFSDDFFIEKTEAGYKFKSRFEKLTSSIEEYRQAFKGFIGVARGTVSNLTLKIKNEETGKEANIEVDFGAYVVQQRMNVCRNRCFENGCEALANLSEELMYRLSGARLSNETLKEAEAAYLKMNEFSKNRYVSNISFYNTAITFELDDKGYEIQYHTKTITEIWG